MLVIAVGSVNALSAIRAYVAGHAVWTGAEGETLNELLRYSYNPTPEQLAQADQAIAIWAGDHTARLELLKAQPDNAAARRGLIAGKNHPDDIGGMIWLFRAMRAAPSWQAPLRFWAQADAQFERYLSIRRQMVEDRALSSAPQAADWRAELRDIHAPISTLERSFSGAIDDDARKLTAYLQLFLCVSAAVLLLVGYGATRRILRRTDAMAAALSASERQAYEEHERATVLLRSISDAVIATDRHGRVQFLNAAAEQLTGWPASDAGGRALEEILQLSGGADSAALPMRDAVAQVLAEAQLTQLATHTAELVRRDGSIVPISERAAPLKHRDGEVIGLVIVMRDVTPERRLADELRHQATHDALTGLPNRAHFEKSLDATLQRCRDGTRAYAAMFIDLDQFKIVNDTCGHHAGDELIRLVAGAIKHELPDGTLPARLGGDEFGLVLQNCSLEQALDTAERIRMAVERLRFVSEGRTFIVHASVGLVHDDRSLRTVTDVLRAADRACYAAKEAGRNRVRIYRADDREIDGRRGQMQWIAQLNNALEQDRFILYAQQIKPIGRGSNVLHTSVEILLRLQDEQGQIVTPMAFIPAAEHFGLMPKIDRWVIEHACAEQSRRRRAQLPAPLCMINLSSASIDDLEVVQYVADRLRHYGLPAGSIGFELTETAAVTRLATAVNVVHRLKELGCPVALDDFGSGVSSYGYLRELPVDMIKIDGRFVRDIIRDPVAHAMVEAMQKVARTMNIPTVAEWVESEAILEMLVLMQIDYAQGRGISIEQPWTHALEAGAAQTTERAPPPALARSQ